MSHLAVVKSNDGTHLKLQSATGDPHVGSALLRLYAIVRNDAGMPHGKAISQAGHAYVGAFVEAQHSAPDVLAAYQSDPPGTKVALQANLREILRAKDEAERAGLPVYLVIDSGCPDLFGGAPTVTALGVGPCTRAKMPKFISRLKLL